MVGDPEPEGPGEAYLIFGAENAGEILFADGNTTSLDSLGDLGVTYDTVSETDFDAGFSVHISGDLNGDGLGDIIIGVPSIAGDYRGSTWVVYGDLELFNSNLYFEVEGLTTADARRLTVAYPYGTYEPAHQFGFSVASGNFNGDSLQDIVVGAPASNQSNESGDNALPRAAIVFGADPIPNTSGVVAVDNTMLETTGIQFGDDLQGGDGNPFFDNRFGQAVAAGDIDGDGKDDLIAGANSGLYDSSYFGGAAILFGSDSLDSIMYANEFGGEDGFRLFTETGQGGDNVAFLGDINGDGKGDFAVTDNNAGGTGRIYVVFGKSKPFASMTIDGGGLDGSNGFVIQFDMYEYEPRIAGNADLNGDGRMDIVVSVDAEGEQTSAAHVIFGAEDIGSSGEIDIGATELDGSNGLTIGFPESADGSPKSIAFGDLNADGYDDIILGVNSLSSFSNNGAVYVIFGLRRDQSAGGEE